MIKMIKRNESREETKEEYEERWLWHNKDNELKTCKEFDNSWNNHLLKLELEDKSYEGYIAEWKKSLRKLKKFVVKFK